MKIKNLLLLAFIGCALSMNAQTKLSPYSRNVIAINKQKNVAASDILIKSRSVDRIGDNTTVTAFVEIKDNSALDAIEALGAQIGTKAGDIITVALPIDKVEAMAALDNVKKVELSKKVYLKNDKARSATFVSNVQSGLNLDQPYNGNGVIYGTLDTGIDLGHINFKDDNGNLRIMRVYRPDIAGENSPEGYLLDSKGNIIGTGTLPGSEYITSEAILALETDNKSESHGSHTMGIGAGSYKLNGYQGMAPESEIIACASKNLGNADIVNATNYVFNIAKKNNKAAVMSLSLGDNQGPHDGTTLLERSLASLANKGNIIVLSAGNEGNDPLYITKTISGVTDTLKSFIMDYNDQARYLYGSSDTWGTTSSPITAQVIVYNKKTNAILYRSAAFTASETGSTMEIKSTSDANFKKYYDGSIYLSGGLDSNGRFNVNISYDTPIANYSTSSSQPTYRLGLLFTSAVGNTLHSWTEDYYSYYSSENVSGFTGGSSNFSINSMATGENTISVGAYCSRNTYKNISGSTLRVGGTLNDIANFSSYGPDFNGIERPDIVAPGYPLVSSVNSYDTETVVKSRSSLAYEITADNRKHQWATMSGTSMSCPAVAGILATWLQADPTLDSDEIKAIFKKTAIRDSYVTSGDAHAWGAGKIDAYAGIVEVLKNSSVEGAITNKDVVMIYPNPSNGVFDIYVQNETEPININIYDIKGDLVYSDILDASQGKINVDVSNQLSNGIYIVNIKGNNCNASSRLMIK